MPTPYRVTSQFWDHATLWSADDESLAGHTTDGGRVFGITRTRYVECDRYGCRPVAVVAFEDREQVERLVAIWGGGSDDVPELQAALREFANPTPPKPEEPQGLGAVVEDAKAKRWVRAKTAWWSEDLMRVSAYADIPAVRVLSEGVA